MKKLPWRLLVPLFDVFSVRAPEKRPVLGAEGLVMILRLPTESSLGVMTVAPPQTALAVLIPSMVYPLVSNWPPLALAEAPFSVAKILLECPRLPPPLDEAPVCVPGDWNPPPPPCCAPSARTPGAS